MHGADREEIWTLFRCHGFILRDKRCHQEGRYRSSREGRGLEFSIKRYQVKDLELTRRDFEDYLKRYPNGSTDYCVMDTFMFNKYAQRNGYPIEAEPRTARRSTGREYNSYHGSLVDEKGMEEWVRNAQIEDDQARFQSIQSRETSERKQRKRLQRESTEPRARKTVRNQESDYDELLQMADEMSIGQGYTEEELEYRPMFRKPRSKFEKWFQIAIYLLIMWFLLWLLWAGFSFVYRIAMFFLEPIFIILRFIF